MNVFPKKWLASVLAAMAAPIHRPRPMRIGKPPRSEREKRQPLGARLITARSRRALTMCRALNRRAWKEAA